MATYVLVHGACQGGWIWKRAATRLRAAGHSVYAPTLDGCGERQHLVRPGITVTWQAQEIAQGGGEPFAGGRLLFRGGSSLAMTYVQLYTELSEGTALSTKTVAKKFALTAGSDQANPRSSGLHE